MELPGGGVTLFDPPAAERADPCYARFLVYYYVLGELVGTQRKKAEHAMFENQFERRASSTKRVRNAKAKTCAEDHMTPF